MSSWRPAPPATPCLKMPRRSPATRASAVTRAMSPGAPRVWMASAVKAVSAAGETRRVSGMGRGTLLGEGDADGEGDAALLLQGGHVHPAAEDLGGAVGAVAG